MAEMVTLNDPSDLDALLDRTPESLVEVEEEQAPERPAASEPPGDVGEIDASELHSLRQKATMVDRFYSDPAFALETVQQVAQKLGYTVTKPDAAAPQQAVEVPAWAQQAAQQALAGDQDLGFLAPVIAKAAYAITQQQMAPYAQQQQQAVEQQRQLEFERTAQELEQEGAAWRDHEDEMMERLTFLRQALNGGSLSHPRYGSLLKLLYQWTTGERTAQAEAGRRMQRAVVNRSQASTPAVQPAPDVRALIKEAQHPQDKWEVAMKAALQEVRAGLRGA